MNIKKWIRKKYIFWKYKHNWNTGKVIILKEGDRQLGLTTMMLEDCLKNDYVLLVPTETHKKNMAHEIYKCGQLGFLPAITEKGAYEKYLISSNDITMGKHRGKRLKIITDTYCWDWDEIACLRPHIVNGFLYLDIAA